MFKKTGNFLLLAAVIFFCARAYTVHAAGFQLFNELSAKTTGNSGAMSARYDVAECAWFNPAGAALMERPTVTAGGALIFPSMELDNDGDDPNLKHIAYPVPYMYGAMPFMDRFGVSLSVNAPYGLTTEWDNDWEGRYYAQYTELSTVFITPAVSGKVLDWLSLSAGLQMVYVDAEMRKFIPTRLGDVYTKIEGDDWGAGYVLSAMAVPFDDWSFGITYHSHVSTRIDGDAKYERPALPPPYDSVMQDLFPKSDVTLPMDLPATLSLAVSTTMLKNFRFSGELLWTQWSAYENLKFNYDQSPGTGQEGIVEVNKDWDDVWCVRFGVEYYLNDQWTFRLSYAWDESPIDDDYRDPSLSTNDRNIFGFGVGWAWNQLTVDAAYSYVAVEDAKVGKKATPTLDGTYKGDAHIANLSFSWTF